MTQDEAVRRSCRFFLAAPKYEIFAAAVLSHRSNDGESRHVGTVIGNRIAPVAFHIVLSEHMGH